MASKINNIQDLQIERMRVKVLLAQQEDKLEQHYEYISGKIRPFTGIIDAFGSFSGNPEKGSSRSAWMGLVGTILQVGLPIIISRYFNKPDASKPTSWWGNILSTLSSFVDKDIVRMVVERVTGGKVENEEEVTEDAEEGHA